MSYSCEATYRTGLIFASEKCTFTMLQPRVFKDEVTGYCLETGKDAIWKKGVFQEGKNSFPLEENQEKEVWKYKETVEAILTAYNQRMKKETEDILIYRSSEGTFYVTTKTEEDMGRYSPRFLQGFHYFLKMRLEVNYSFDEIQRLIGHGLTNRMAGVKEEEPFRGTLEQFYGFILKDKEAA
ncbi:MULTISPECIES: hypothetical protein [unclassified Psychrobacillus]|uniref:hypothetical protein n=1 Tax=unclassified Psychrobacillus TaxID=2636677 RepID=UPI0030F528A0